MKLTDIIRKQNEISEGTAQFFIAECDFSYFGLPILKDSLVNYDGKRKLSVNIVLFGVFQESHVHELVAKQLPYDDDERYYTVEKCSSCELELENLRLGSTGIWHSNHFDPWQPYKKYEERIHQLPILEYSGIAFSSLMYRYDSVTKSLTSFINVKPINLKINEKSLELPAFLEIGRNETGYFIIPVIEMEYFGITFKQACTLSDNGILRGDCEKAFKAEIIGHSEFSVLTISSYSTLEISAEGNIEIWLIDEKTNKKEKYRIKKL